MLLADDVAELSLDLDEEKLPDLKSPPVLLLELELSVFLELSVLELLLDLGEEKLPDLKSPPLLLLELELVVVLVVVLELVLLLDFDGEKLLDLKLLPEDFEVLLVEEELLDFEPPDLELLACMLLESVFVLKLIDCGVTTYTHKNKKVSDRDMIKHFLFNLILHTSLFRSI
ncbi:hypothetical protein [Clostridium sp.]|uniref:hypothetical protein n=1 Tax=Clostridium sp. TaxID=1506 RepID=UPI002FDE7087